MNGERPDSMTLIPWSHRKSILWDVTVEIHYRLHTLMNLARKHGY